MNMTLLSAYILAVLMLLLTPGPVVALVTGTAARYGSRRAFATVTGTNGASLVLIMLAVLMLAGIISFSPLFLYLLGTAGSLYIGWGAMSNIRAVSKKSSAQETTLSGEAGGFVRGFLTGISNPKDILFFVAFFPQFIAVTEDFTASIMTLSLVWIFFDFAVLSFYILMIKRWMPERHARCIEMVSSLFLLAVSMCGILYNAKEIFTRYV